MSPEAVNLVERASALLLHASDAAERAGCSEDTTDAVRSALASFARAYLIDKGENGIPEQDDGCLRHFFGVAPQWLGAKVAVLLRKLNYLTYSAPYMPALQDEGEWDGQAMQTEIKTACREASALCGFLVRKAVVPDFRGEESLCFAPGDWIEYSEFDWGAWRPRAAVVLAARWPQLLVRYEDRRIDELDLTIAFVRPLDRPPVDLSSPVEARRTAFERLLAARKLEPESSRVSEAVLGTARYIRTCPCCGYLTRRLRVPDYARLSGHAHPMVPACVLCGWNDSDHAAEANPSRPSRGPNGRYSLDRARENFGVHHSIFDESDASVEAERHHLPGVRKQKAAAIALLDAVVESSDPDERSQMWTSAWQLLRRMSGERESERSDNGQVDSRIGTAVRTAAAEL